MTLVIAGRTEDGAGGIDPQFTWPVKQAEGGFTR